MTQIFGDRERALLDREDEFTGIDFIHVADGCDQRELHVYFLTDAQKLTVGFQGETAFGPEDIEIVRVDDASARPLRVAEILSVDGSQVQVHPEFGRTYLAVRVVEPGGFGNYRLTLLDPRASTDPLTEPFSRIDPIFNGKIFSFKAACESEADCLTEEPPCPAEESVDFPVDYLARDFTSFRSALLDYAAQRYPKWQYPLEADVGTMLAEVLAALGDELSYMQDRYAREAYLETATQRRSLRKKARLVDFEIHDGRSPSTWLSLEVTADDAAGPRALPAASRAWARSDGGESIAFELGRGLQDETHYLVHSSWNESSLIPYCFDERQACLPVGARELYVMGHVTSPEVLTSTSASRRLLLATDPSNPATPARRLLLTLESVTHAVDPLGAERFVTRLRFREPLPYQIDQKILRVGLNVVPATAGETLTEEFVVRSEEELLDAEHAVVRRGPLTNRGAANDLQSIAEDLCAVRAQPRWGRAPVALYGLRETETRGLGFTGAALRATSPEVQVSLVETGERWGYRRQLLGASAQDSVFTLEDGSFRRVRSFRSATGEFVHQDYATGAGYSLRFGDGVFGRVPPAGSRFRVVYRTGPGTRANVPSNTLNARSRAMDQTDDQAFPSWVSSFYNPLPVTQGVDPESLEEIRLLAPEAYQHSLLFAVRPEDYGERAEDLNFVQRANAATRWTGTWLSTFVTLDPLGASELSAEQWEQAEAWMDCVRQTGRDVLVLAPSYVPIDLTVNICVEPSAYASQVLSQVRAVLVGGVEGVLPFFHPDHFSFGTPLHRAALEAKIQSVPGVRSVRRMRVRMRGVSPMRDFRQLSLEVAPNQVLRLDDDPARPDDGTLLLSAEGGA